MKIHKTDKSDSGLRKFKKQNQPTNKFSHQLQLGTRFQVCGIYQQRAETHKPSRRQHPFPLEGALGSKTSSLTISQANSGRLPFVVAARATCQQSDNLCHINYRGRELRTHTELDSLSTL